MGARRFDEPQHRERICNYELDAIIEDADFARVMERQYEADLRTATELLLRMERRRVPRGGKPAHASGSAGRAAAAAIRLGHTVTAAVANRRVLAPTEARIVAFTARAFLAAACAAALWPRLVAWPLAAILSWFGARVGTRGPARTLRTRAHPERPAEPPKRSGRKHHPQPGTLATSGMRFR